MLESKQFFTTMLTPTYLNWHLSSQWPWASGRLPIPLPNHQERQPTHHQGRLRGNHQLSSYKNCIMRPQHVDLNQDWKELDFAVDKDEELEKGKHKLLNFFRRSSRRATVPTVKRKQLCSNLLLPRCETKFPSRDLFSPFFRTKFRKQSTRCYHKQGSEKIIGKCPKIWAIKCFFFQIINKDQKQPEQKLQISDASIWKYLRL